ncbi:MAG TPA: aminotransferase class IV, partial [Puia sp.]|nr:aminotransferase class IV [Puia sp.]
MFLNFNGDLRKEEDLVLSAGNRGFRYGDGLFETMLVQDGSVRLGRYHIDRLSAGMRMLRLEPAASFSTDTIESWIRDLCMMNRLKADCRARLTVFRATGGMYNVPDSRAGYLLQVGETGLAADGAGLTLGVFPEGRKVCDALAALKSNNYLLS